MRRLDAALVGGGFTAFFEQAQLKRGRDKFRPTKALTGQRTPKS
jgi:hypothetical protein